MTTDNQLAPTDAEIDALWALLARAAIASPTKFAREVLARWGQPAHSSSSLTPIRRAALDIYTPPFRCEHGYVRDANNETVADDAGEEMVGVIAARIRGWGRIQYMDNPEGRAAALQDEVGEIVAQALNEHWAANGIKGGQNADT